MSLALASRKAALLVPWLRNPLWAAARAVPSLDLRFADSKSLVDSVSGQSLVTFTRASDAMVTTSAGQLLTVPANTPRFDHHPTTGESLGLLIEEQRTNSIRNNTMVGAVAGTPGTLPTNWVSLAQAGGLTREIIGTGTSDGINYIDIRYSGTTSDANSVNLAFDGNTAIAATNGQSWTGSAYAAIIAGSLSNISSATVRVTERTGAGSFVAITETSIASATATLRNNRFSASRTLGATAGAVQGNIFLSIASGVAIDITLRIGMPQLEQGAFATSVIPTTGTAATRSADVCSITGSAFSGFYRQDQGTVFANALSISPSSLFPCAASANDGTSSNRIQIGRTNSSGAALRVFVVSGGATTVDGMAVGSTTAGAFGRVAFGYQLNNFGGATNGSLATPDTSGAVPVVNQLQIGDAVAGGPLNGCISRLTFWPQRLSNEVLQRITQ